MAKMLEARSSRERPPGLGAAETGALVGMRFEGVVGPGHFWWILRGLIVKRFTRRLVKSWARATNQRMAVVGQLRPLAAWNRYQTHRVRQQVRRAVFLQVLSDMVQWALMFVTFGATLIALLGFTAAAILLLTHGYAWWNWASAPVLIVALLAIVGGLPGPVVRATPNLATAVAAELTFTVSYLAVVGLVVSYHGYLGPIGLPLFVAFGTYSVVTAVNAFAFLVVVPLRRYRNTNYPLETLVYWLTDLLSLLELPPRRSVGSAFRTSVLQKIEDMALLIERDLPRSYRASNAIDRSTFEWYKSECRSQATAMRDLKREVLMPTPESSDALLSRVAQATVVVGLGQLGLLEKSEADVAVPGRLARFLRVLPSVCIGLLPLAAIVALQVSRLAIQGPLGQTLLGIAVVLAIANLLVFDPRYRDKLDAFKSLWPGSPKTGG